jgi:hypothetical protein
MILTLSNAFICSGVPDEVGPFEQGFEARARPAKRVNPGQAIDQATKTEAKLH